MKQKTNLSLGSRFLSGFGHAWEWLIQKWVETTGKEVDAAQVPWLAGPTGKYKIGSGFYESYASEAGLTLQHLPDAGLLQKESFDSLKSSHFAPEKVHPAVRDFYERTARYTLDVWVQWGGLISPFARFMITSISHNIEQLNLPLTPLTTSSGMSSEIIGLARKSANPPSIVYTGWLRKTNATGEIVYAGFYTTCQPPAYVGRCVKVVFPLPQGSATVLLKPVNGPGGSLKLVSRGRRFGGPGYYRIHRKSNGRLRVKHIPIEETIHVYFEGDDEFGVLHTVHDFKFWKLRFLTLHYRMTIKQK
jgi:hypothetical protein